MADECMLTTIDNPYNPFENVREWLLFDKEHGYNTCEKIDRLSEIKESMSEREINEEMERAMNEIINLDILHVYVKVRRSDTSMPWAMTNKN